MTDKVQKIREEVVRLRNLHQMKYQQIDTNDNMCLVECGKHNLCNELLSFIDSLQEEPKFKIGQIITDPEDKTFTFHINRIENGKYIESDDAWVLIKDADEEYELVEEPVSEDLEKAIDTFLATYFGSEKEKQEWPFLKKMAIHFAEWQKQKDSIPVSEELEVASKEWLSSQLDKYYAVYGETKQMELTRFDGYAMLDAIEFGVKWQKKQDLETIELAEDHAMLAGMVKGIEKTIEKACNYLHEHREEVKTEDNGIAGWISDEFIENFRKNMEGYRS